MPCRNDSYCGLYCGACDIVIAEERGNLRELAEKIGRSEKFFSCDGCKSDNLADYAMDCDIRRCARRSIDFCIECDIYPCSMIMDFANDKHIHHKTALKNLETIKKKGIDEWLKEQDKRWRCSCGEKFSFYDDICKCGKTLFNCIREAESNTQ